MNDNLISGKWKEIKGDIMRTWGKLTDDEVEESKGNMSGLAGTIQKKFGLAQEEAAAKLNRIVDKYRNEDSNKSSTTDSNYNN
jgi:uncharacterized protein YjbJ (UPF0337 family)